MNLDHLLRSLLALPGETAWVEFKHNNDAPEEISEYLSALANSAALHGRDAGYVAWGIEDVTKRVVGTTANPRRKKIGNEELENWLAHLLSPRVDFRFHEWDHQGHRMVLLQVQPAVGSPVAFRGTEWIRVGSLKKKLKDHPGKEKELWQALSRLSFEKGIAAPGATGDEVLAWLDYPKYFELTGLSLPANRAGILERLAAMMRRLNICEERGTGIDKVIAEIELYQLPAPDFQATPKHTRAFLYAPRKYAQMDPEARIRACYQHACLCWVVNKPMTNATVRERFGIEAKNAAIASRIIAETVKAALVKPTDPGSKSKKHAQYVPFWL